MDRLKQELELAESSRSKFTRGSVYLGDFLLGLSSLRLSSSPDTDSITSPILSRVKLAIFSGSERKPSVIIWRSRWLRLMYTFWVIYGSIKCTLMLLIQLHYEQKVSMTVPGLCERINGTSCCLLRAPKKIERNYAEVDKISYLFETIGHPMANVPVVSTLMLMYLTSFIIIAYMVNLSIIKNSVLLVDFMGFMSNPIGEMRRLNEVLGRITSELSESYLNRLGKGRCECMLNDDGEGCFKSCLSVKLMYDLCQTLDQNELRSNNKRVNPKSFLSTLPEASRHVNPAHMDARWHEHLTKSFYRGTLFFIILSMLFTSINYFYVIYHCIQWKMLLAFERARCFRLNPAYRQLHNHHINPLIYQVGHVNLSSWIPVTGEQPEWSGWQRFHMTTTLGARIYFRPQKILSMIEMYIALMLLCAWTVTIMMIFILSILDKRRWFRQVEEQLEECIAEESSAEPDHHRCLQLTTSTYLNYALFKSQLVRYRPVTNLILTSVLLFTSTSLTGIYISSERDETVDTLTLTTLNFSILTLLLISNVYFIMGSYLFAKAEEMMKLVVKHLGVYNNMQPLEESETSLGLEFIMSIWQRQLLDREELVKDYALNFMGISVTFEKVLPINAYSLAMILLMVKY